ncbi:MAG: hypothetical protein EOP83_34190, partial [Verrucomicrobiaceae bacterium]
MATYIESKKLWKSQARIKLADGKAKRIAEYGATAESADGKLAATVALLTGNHDGSYRGFVVLGYLPTLRKKSEAWREQVRSIMEVHLLPAFGHQDLKEITRPKVQQYFEGLEARMEHGEIGAWHIRHIHKVLKASLELAFQDGLIARNPVWKVELPPIPEAGTVITLEQLADLVAYGARGVWGPAVALGTLGLRVGEILGTQMSDLTEDNLVVEWQVITRGKGAKRVTKLVNKLKTPTSHRSIPLPAGYAALILSLRAESDSPMVCPGGIAPGQKVGTERASYLNPDNASRGMQQAIARVNAAYVAHHRGKGEPPVFPNITFHDLRRTFKSIMDDIG